MDKFLSGSGQHQHNEINSDHHNIGLVCQKKVIMSEEIVFEEHKQCNHIYEEHCYPMYKTVMEFKRVNLTSQNNCFKCPLNVNSFLGKRLQDCFQKSLLSRLS